MLWQVVSPRVDGEELKARTAPLVWRMEGSGARRTARRRGRHDIRAASRRWDSVRLMAQPTIVKTLQPRRRRRYSNDFNLHRHGEHWHLRLDGLITLVVFFLRRVCRHFLDQPRLLGLA